MKLHDRIDMGLYGKPLGCSISFDPITYTEGGGGFLDDLDVTFLALKCITSEGTPYNSSGKVVPLLKVSMLADGTEDVHDQYYSCGDLANWAPSPDGETMVGQNEKTRAPGAGIRKDSNAGMFLSSLVQAGVPGAKLATERISDLAGIKAHVVRTKRPKDNIKRAEGAKEPDVLTVSRLISVPWGGVAASPVVAAKAYAQPATAPAPSGNGHTVFGNAELAALAVQVLLEKGALPKTQLMLETYKKAVGGAVAADAKDEAGKPARTTVAEKMNSDAFLGSQPFWRYDGATVTLV